MNRRSFLVLVGGVVVAAFATPTSNVNAIFARVIASFRAVFADPSRRPLRFKDLTVANLTEPPIAHFLPVTDAMIQDYLQAATRA